VQNNIETKKEEFAIDFNTIAEVAGCSADFVRKINKGTRKNELIQAMLADAKIGREIFLLKWLPKTNK
jgi:TnpA family transposase